MAFEEHPRFETPARHMSIWRFMDFEKFIALLESRTLYFSSIESLLEQDPFEGSYSDAYQFWLITEWEDIPDIIKQELFNNEISTFYNSRELAFHVNENAEKMKKTTFVNCWHLSAYSGRIPPPIML